MAVRRVHDQLHDLSTTCEFHMLSTAPHRPLACLSTVRQLPASFARRLWAVYGVWIINAYMRSNLLILGVSSCRYLGDLLGLSELHRRVAFDRQMYLSKHTYIMRSFVAHSLMLLPWYPDVEFPSPFIASAQRHCSDITSAILRA